MTPLLQNTLITAEESLTLFDALYSLPPRVIDGFWKLTDAATDADARAKACGASDRTQGRLLLVLALKLFTDVLKDAAIPDSELEERLKDPHEHTDAEMEALLLNGGYFRETTYFMTRVVEYTRKMLRYYTPHPSYVTDLNMLLNAVERLSGFTPVVPVSRETPTAVSPTGNPSDQDFLFLARSVAGEPETWFNTENEFSEFNMFKPVGTAPEVPNKAGRGRPREDLIYYLTRVWGGSTATEVDELVNRQREAWKNEQLNKCTKAPPGQPAEIARNDEREETWFFINGVATDDWIAQLNAEHLATIFQRKIHILHKPTRGLDRDLRECVRGRLEGNIGVATQLRKKLEREVNGKGRKKVVLIAHSEGTIIASAIVRNLPLALTKKMEVYNFAFCADQFPADVCRHVEHFVNERDFVPSLSIVPENYYHVPGNIFRQAGKYGHLLSAHYLPSFVKGKYIGPFGHRSVLSQYVGGQNYGEILQ